MTNVGLGPRLILTGLLLIVVGRLVWDTAGRRVWLFQRRRLKLRFRLPRWLRWIRRRKYTVEMTTLRDFVVNLQLAVSLAETLGGALAVTAEQFADRGVFGERLQRHVETRLAIAPDEVIKALAYDFDSQPLRDLLDRLDIARDGGITRREALQITAEELDERIRIDVEREMQRAPVVLTIPMVAGVFFACLLLLIYPVAVRVMEGLSAAPR